MYRSVHLNDAMLYRRALAYLITIAIVLYVSFRKYWRDPVILCEALGVGVFAIGLLVCAMFGFSRWLFLASGLLALLFGFLALCFSVADRLHRRKRRAAHR